MIYKGTTSQKAFKGSHKPVNIYKGSTKVAGWQNQTKTGQSISFDNTYDDVAEVTATGNIMNLSNSLSKNLFDKSKYASLSNYLVIGTTYRYMYLQLVPNTTYKVSITRLTGWTGTEGGTLLISDRTTFSVYTSIAHPTAPNTNSSPYTTDHSGLLYIGVTLATTQEQLTNILANTLIQIEAGSATTAYVDFVQAPVPTMSSPLYPTFADGSIGLASGSINVSTVSMGILRSIGGVSDSYNITTGEHIQRIGVRSWTGAESNNWLKYTPTTFANVYYDYPYADNVVGYQKSVCSHFANLSVINAIEGLNDYYTDHASVPRHYFNVGNLFPTLTEWRAWVTSQYQAGTPLTLYYQLATPVVTYKTPQQLMTFYGATNVIQPTGTVKADLSVTAKIMEV